MDWTHSFSTELMTGERIDADEANIINAEGELEEFEDYSTSDLNQE